MPERTSGSSKGLLESLTTLGATLVAMTHTRLELLSNELEEDKAHVLSLLVTALVALFCLGVGVLLAAMLLVVLFWDTHRLLALGSLTGFFLAAGTAACVFAMRKASNRPRIFAASLSELRKDYRQLASRP